MFYIHCQIQQTDYYAMCLSVIKTVNLFMEILKLWHINMTVLGQPSHTASTCMIWQHRLEKLEAILSPPQ